MKRYRMRKNRHFILTDTSQLNYELIQLKYSKEFDFDLYQILVKVLRQYANKPCPIIFYECAIRYDSNYFKMNCSFVIEKDDVTVTCDIERVEIDEYIDYNLQLPNNTDLVSYEKYLEYKNRMNKKKGTKI